MTSKDSARSETLALLEGTSTSRQQITRQLVMLNAALMEISATLNREEIQDLVTEEFVNIFSAEACSLIHWDKEKDVLSVQPRRYIP